MQGEQFAKNHNEEPCRANGEQHDVILIEPKTSNSSEESVN
jgi:hypothetical protein